MRPVIFELNSRHIRSYDVFLCVAIAVCLILVWYEARRARYPAGLLMVCLSGTAASAIIGARINGWLFWYRGNPEMLDLKITATNRGMTAFGGIIGAMVFIGLYAYLVRWNVRRLMDIIIPAFALGESIQRIGCFLNGCCYGHITSSSLGFYLPDTLGIWSYRYPTQIITGVFCAVLFYWLWRKRKKTPFEGALLLYYLVYYNIGRLIIDFLRGDEPVALGFLTSHQLTAALIALIAAIVMYFALALQIKKL